MIDYMRCAILAAIPAGIDNWDIETLRGVYHLLPRPEIGFAEWRRRMNGGDASEAMADANERFIRFAQDAQDLKAPIAVIETGVTNE